jgi:Neocarzinostatin family
MKGRAWWALAACAVTTAVVAAVPDTGSVAASGSTAVPSILVTPSSGLVSGQVVTVTGSGFTASAQVVLSDCLTETTLGYCGGIPPDSVIADSSGNFTYQFRVGRGTFDESVYPPVLVDCARAPEACSVFAFVGFPVERAAAPISFDASVPPPSAVVTVTPSRAVGDGLMLRVAGSGFSANTGVFVGQCAPGVPADFLASPCGFPGGVLPIDSQGNLLTSVTVRRLFPLPVTVDGRNDFDCSTAPGACFVRVTSMAEPLETVDTPITFASAPTVVAGPMPVEAPSPAFTG